MNKRLIFILLITLALVGLYKGNEAVRGYVLNFTNTLKSIYLDLEYSLLQKINNHFKQIEKIETLIQQNRQLLQYKIAYKNLLSTLQNFQRDCNITFAANSVHLLYTKALSYVSFGDFTSLWLEADLDKNKVYGLLKGENVAGVALRKDSKALALLNGNKKCSYGVLVANSVSGIAVGSGDNRFINVKYIPNYATVKVGDKVITSGLDGIFIYGVGVGEVIKVWQEGSYKVARVRTYADLSYPRFFWLMKL
ncbi:rod shape-determining protein MreC [Nitratiruptor sp. YY09-18]|uniref:rod shape-determining protein MreC n=1 Tax=Nitratiruptor sp. YY09-18 TaxID=2724901 RepID=UPI00191571E9|nr:rod shape-determining protein MreC [Nitratiruptor sp. YY09-18]BCD68452.1 rod shape-determining protein MreC [Nitratiruptor sp. YY09-18]